MHIQKCKRFFHFSQSQLIQWLNGWIKDRRDPLLGQPSAMEPHWVTFNQWIFSACPTLKRWDINLTSKINTFATKHICFSFFCVCASIFLSWWSSIICILYAVLPGATENVYHKTELMANEIAPELYEKELWISDFCLDGVGEILGKYY